MLNLKPGKLYKILPNQNIAVFRFPDGTVIDIFTPLNDAIFLYLGYLPPDIFNERNNFKIKNNVDFIRHKILLTDGQLAYINLGRTENQQIIYYDPSMKWIEIFP